MWDPTPKTQLPLMLMKYVNLTEEHNGLAPESLSCHLRELWGGDGSPISNLEKYWFGCNDLAQEGQRQTS